MKSRSLASLFLATAGLLAVTLVFIYWVGIHAAQANRKVTSQTAVIAQLDEVLSALKDAETGARGYLLTGKEAYLEPYAAAVRELEPGREALRRLAQTGDLAGPDVEALTGLMQQKMAELEQTLSVRRTNAAAAVEAVQSGEGKRIMDTIRSRVARMRQAERAELERASAYALASVYLRTVVFGLGLLVNLVFLAWVYRRLTREMAGRAAAALALRQSELKYRWLHDTLRDAFVIVDMQGRIQDCNPVYEQMLGYTREELRALTYQDLTPEKWHAQEARLVAEEIVPKGTSGVYQKEYRRKDGSVFPLELRTFLIRDEAGEPHQMWALVRDITERKEAEEALRRSEERYRELVEQMADGLFVASPEGRYLDVNPAGCALLGMTREEVLRSSFADVLLPEKYNRVPGTIASFADGQVHRSEWHFRRKDGSVFVGALAGRRLADGRLQGLLRDVTEQRRAQEALQERDRRFSTLLENLKTGVALVDGVGRFELHNQALLRIFGLSSEMKNLNSQDWGQWQVFAEDGHLLTLDEHPVRRAALRRMAVKDHLVRVRRPSDGEELWLLVSAEPLLRADGQLHQLICTYYDITEWKRAEQAVRQREERFRSITDTTPVLMWMTDTQGRMEFVNRAYREFFGVTLDQVIEVDKWQPLVHPEDRDRYISACAEALARQERFVAEARMKRADGEWRWVQSYGAPRFSEQGEFLGMAGSSPDITERKEFQTELERLVAERTAKLKELVGELEHFSYSITHDMRAPLRGMQGFAEAMTEALENGDKAEAETFLRRIRTSATRMDLLITDALQYAKAVRRELPLAPVDAGELLRGMIDSYPEFQSERAHIELAGEIPLVMGNEAGLTQVFSNLLGNAVKFVKTGQVPQVRIRAERVRSAEETGQWVRIWVEDQGIGMTEAMKARAFDMFSRGHSNHEYEGTGIGLALVRKVVQHMGGHVGVEAGPGQGSRFWVELRDGEMGNSEGLR